MSFEPGQMTLPTLASLSRPSFLEVTKMEWFASGVKDRTQLAHLAMQEWDSAA